MPFSPENFQDQNAGNPVRAAWLNNVDEMVNGALGGTPTVPAVLAALGIVAGITAVPVPISEGGTASTNAAAALASLGVNQAYIAGQLTPQTAAEAAAGAVPVNLWWPPGCVDRYGSNSIPGSTPMTAAFQAAINQCRKGGSKITPGPTGQYLITGELDCTSGTGDQFGLVFDWSNAPISVDYNAGSTPSIYASFTVGTGGATTGHLFDLTGCDNYRFTGMTIGSNSASYPKTCWFQARNSSGGSCQGRIDNCRVYGYFSNSVQYNYAHEEGCYAENWWFNLAPVVNTRVITITAQNISGLTSSFQTVYSGGISCSDHQYLGGQFFNQGGAGLNDVVYLEGATYLRMFAPWMGNVNPGGTPGRSFFYIDLTNSAASFVDVYGLYTENSSPVPPYGIYCSAAGGGTKPSNWNLEHCAWWLNNYLCYTPTGVTLDHCYFTKNQETNGAVYTNHGIFVTGTAQYCTFDSVSLVLRVGTSIQNALIGFSEAWSVTTRQNDAWMDTGVTNKSFAPGITSGSNGWTAVGAITQSGKSDLNGSTASVVVTISAATTIACGAAATIALPAIFTPAVSTPGLVIDETAGTVLGTCLFTAGGITVTQAISATAHTVAISGTYFVA